MGSLFMAQHAHVLNRRILVEAEIFFCAIPRCAIFTPIMIRLLWLCVVIAFSGCSIATFTPGATLLAGVTQYQRDMQQFGSSMARWPERQRAGGSLKAIVTATVGGSAEFYRLIDLDIRKREFIATMRQTSVRPERMKEMTEELGQMNDEIAALKAGDSSATRGPAVSERARASRGRGRHSRSHQYGARRLFIQRRRARSGVAVDQSGPIHDYRHGRVFHGEGGRRRSLSLRSFWRF